MAADWALKNSPRLADSDAGSCLLGSDDQCVEKATTLLSALRKQLEQWRLKEIDKRESQIMATVESSVQGQESIPKAKAKVSIESPGIDSQLSVRGTKTGEAKMTSSTDVHQSSSGSTSEKTGQFDWSKAEWVISRSLSLVLRLENDRQETVGQLGKEKQKVRGMRAKLDAKAADRLRMLASIVQKEHEQCLQDMLEMKWHVSFEGRHLRQIRDDVQLITQENTKLKDNVNVLSQQFTLLQDKIEDQSSEMADILHKQGEVKSRLKDEEMKYSSVQQKYTKTKVWVDEETWKMDRMILELKHRLEKLGKKLEELLKKQETITASISRAKLKKLECIEQDALRKGELLKVTETYEKLKSKINNLWDTKNSLEKELAALQEVNTQLSASRDEQLSELSGKHSLLEADVQEKTKKMRAAREENINLLHDIEEMKEQIITSRKRTKDAVKSIASAQREFDKVEKQLKVIHQQTDKARLKHRELVLLLRENEDKFEHDEYNLKCTTQSLKDELFHETKVRRTYQGKVLADSEELEKLKVQQRHQYDKVSKEFENTEKSRDSNSKLVSELTDLFNKRRAIEDELRKKVAELTDTLTAVVTELSGRIDVLSPQATQLRSTASEKKSRLKEMKERVHLLTDRIKDTQTSQATVDRMSNEITTAIEELESQKEDLTAKISHEAEVEESWRKEFEEISEFSKAAEEKYSTYTITRQEYFHQLEADAHTALLRNQELANDYESLRARHAETKGTALRAMDSKLLLEYAMRDMGQLLALQSKLNITMRAHYEHRGATGREAVRKCRSTIQSTQDKVTHLHSQFTQVLSGMGQFLREFEREQKALKEKAREGEKPSHNSSSRTGRTARGEKSVSFSIPLECAS